MDCYRWTDCTDEQLEDLCRRDTVTDPSLLRSVKRIIESVERRGDRALRQLTKRYDGASIENFRVAPEAFEQARTQTSKTVQKALRLAAKNIRRYHQAQIQPEGRVEVSKGVLCWRESRPIDSVGLYVPGGTAVLPSTVLMLAIPAKLAGCSKVCLCVPPDRDGSVSSAVLVAAELSEVDTVFRVGGAQAVAALGLGTDSIPKVDKIAGPGNKWVQAAKLLLSMRGVGIDMIAGPSEVLVMADQGAKADWVAADLLAQLEHDPDSRAVLASPSKGLIERAGGLLQEQLKELPRRKIARQALSSSYALWTPDLDACLEFSNRFGPEHLILHLVRPGSWASRVTSAGSVFLGRYSPEVAGDYASGSNHVLPTGGQSRIVSGISVDSFRKQISFQKLSKAGLHSLRKSLTVLATLEGLEGHRRSVECRFQ